MMCTDGRVATQGTWYERNNCRNARAFQEEKIYISVDRLIRGIIECESERLVTRQCQEFRRVD